ncbi:MAG: outer membrane protein assembly factor BamE [Verrucomicrobiales bacterium]
MQFNKIFQISAKLLVLLQILVLTSCALLDESTRENLSHTSLEENSKQVKKGMTMQQVRNILGRPGMRHTVDGVTSWSYTRNNAGQNIGYQLLGPLALIPIATGDFRSESTYTVVTFNSSGIVTKVSRSTMTLGGR